jgi:hypothetical protein
MEALRAVIEDARDRPLHTPSFSDPGCFHIAHGLWVGIVGEVSVQVVGRAMTVSESIEGVANGLGELLRSHRCGFYSLPPSSSFSNCTWFGRT